MSNIDTEAARLAVHVTVREEVAQWLCAHVDRPFMWVRYAEDLRDRFRAEADDLLAGPALAALIADADNWRRATTGDPTEPEPLAMQARDLLVKCRELEATVARVREAVHDFDAFPNHADRAMAMYRLRRALDGEPQP